MMYRCENCGNVFEDPAIVIERHGFSDGPGEEFGVCPYCNGDYAEAKQCEHCSEWFVEDDLCEGWCDSCIDSYQNDIETCYKVGKECPESIKINGFLATMFSNEDVEEILMGKLREAAELLPQKCECFINEDKSWFVETLKGVIDNEY